MSELAYVPLEGFARVRELECPLGVRVALFAALCRINILYMIARAGSGHIGSSFSSIDIVSWLFLSEMRLPAPGREAPHDVYFSSKGHDVPALYAVLIGLGLLDFKYLHEFRRLGGLPGHPDVGTPMVHANTGSLGMGISKAKGMVLANRALGHPGRIYLMTGDGELQEGQIWEALPSAAAHRMEEIVVIVDHNKLQSDTWVADVSDLGDLEAKFEEFGWHAQRCDGHDFDALAEAFRKARNARGVPSVIIADTIKGRGVSFMEPSAMKPDERVYRFHSGAPDEEAYRAAVQELWERAERLAKEAGLGSFPLHLTPRMKRSAPGRSAQHLVSAYGKALVGAARQNERIAVLDADLVVDCGLLPFKESFPDRYFECGIAEQDMASQAGGMALQGLLPFVHSFSSFLSGRANEQIYNNATERTKIIYVGSLAGVLPGAPGHSHQSVRDISALGAVLGLLLVEPCCERELEMLLDFALNRTRESVYLRLVSIPCEIPFGLPNDYRVTEGEGVVLAEGTEAVVFGYGPVLTSQAYEAVMRIRERGGPDIKLVNLPWLNRVNPDWLGETVRGCRSVFTLDNHYVVGGQGAMIAAIMAELGLERMPKVTRFGLCDLPVCGQDPEVLHHHGLDSESLMRKMAKVLGVSLDEG